MHTYTTNVEHVNAHMLAAMNSFGFDSRFEGRALGELIIDNIIGGIVDRSIEKQCTGDGTPWPKNSDTTERRKKKQFGEAIINKDTGQMLSAKSLRGTTTITQFAIQMEYGTGEASPDGATVKVAAGPGDEHAYEPVTDVDKAVYAVQQGRSFYELDQEICDKNFASFSKTLGDHLANPGR